jgi:hypothetical protein
MTHHPIPPKHALLDVLLAADRAQKALDAIDALTEKDAWRFRTTLAIGLAEARIQHERISLLASAALRFPCANQTDARQAESTLRARVGSVRLNDQTQASQGCGPATLANQRFRD